MNRIKISPLVSSNRGTSSADSKSQPIASLFALDKKQSLRPTHETSLFVPLHYEKNYAYPLIVWLHSDGQSSGELHSVMQQVSMRNYVAVAPQAPVGNFECGYYWEQDYDAINAALESVSNAVEMARSRFNINTNRIFLAGLESGGTMAFRAGLQHPDRYAGIASLNGGLPDGRSTMADWNRCRTMPVFWSHSVDSGDPENCLQMCRHFQALYAAGFLNLTAREYPSAAHLRQLAPQAIDRWVMEQIQSAIV